MENKGHCGLLYHHRSVLTSSYEAMGLSTPDRTAESSRLAQGCADLAPLLSGRWVPLLTYNLTWHSSTCCINYQALLGRRISSIFHLHVSRTRSTTETASTSAATVGAKIPPLRHRWALHCWLPVARITFGTWDCHRGCSASRCPPSEGAPLVELEPRLSLDLRHHVLLPPVHDQHRHSRVPGPSRPPCARRTPSPRRSQARSSKA